MTRHIEPDVLELTTDQFHEMLEEYALHETGSLRTEAKRLLEEFKNAENIHQMRLIANRWSLIYDSYAGHHASELGNTIILNLPVKDRLEAALKALKGTMPSIIDLYNQLYAVMQKHDDPGIPQLNELAKSLEVHHPGVSYFLEGTPERIEDAGGQQAQLDVVIGLLLRQPRYKAAHIFHIVGPQDDYGVAVHEDHYSVVFGETEVAVATHPKMNIHSALEVGGLIGTTR